MGAGQGVQRDAIGRIDVHSKGERRGSADQLISPFLSDLRKYGAPSQPHPAVHASRSPFSRPGMVETPPGIALHATGGGDAPPPGLDWKARPFPVVGGADSPRQRAARFRAPASAAPPSDASAEVPSPPGAQPAVPNQRRPGAGCGTTAPDAPRRGRLACTPTKTLASDPALAPNAALLMALAHVRSIRSSACILGALLSTIACGGEDTHTPDACPPQHEYDIRELYAKENANDPDIARRRAAIEAEVEAAHEDGCVTKPTFTPALD